MEDKPSEEGATAPDSRQERFSLYVGDLDPSISECDLIEAFSHLSVVSSSRICRSPSAGSSLRYAYLNFPSRPLAEKALKEMNHSLLKDKPIRVMWRNPDPRARKTGIGNLFVKNLEENVDGAELEKMFLDFGTVVSCKVVLDEKGRSKGYGFVQMESEEAALSVINALNGKALSHGTKKLCVSKFMKKSEREASSLPPVVEPNRSNLYVKNLNPGITDGLLQEKFSEFGKVISAVVMKDEFGKSKGFGFVSFELPQQARNAMEALNGSKLGSKTLYVGQAEKKSERKEKLKKLFAGKLQNPTAMVQIWEVLVHNMDASVDENRLSEQFSTFGTILSSKVIRGVDGQSKGIGYVSFSSQEDANNAVATLNGSMLDGKVLKVEIVWPKSQAPRSAQDLPTKNAFNTSKNSIYSSTFEPDVEWPQYLLQEPQTAIHPQYAMGHPMISSDFVRHPMKNATFGFNPLHMMTRNKFSGGYDSHHNAQSSARRDTAPNPRFQTPTASGFRREAGSSAHSLQG